MSGCIHCDDLALEVFHLEGQLDYVHDEREKQEDALNRAYDEISRLAEVIIGLKEELRDMASAKTHGHSIMYGGAII